MNSPHKSSGLIKADSAASTSSVVHNVFLSSLAVKAIARATKKVDEDSNTPGLDSHRQRRALIKSYAEASFRALTKQAALQGYVPWDLADAATLESMAVVDAQIDETVQKVVDQVATGTLPLDQNPHSAGPSEGTTPIEAYIAPMSVGHRTTPSTAAASRSDWPDMARYTYMNELGSGGFGKVFLVVDQLLGRQYALKQIQLSEKATVREVEGVVAEVRALAQMSHGNVVRLYYAWAEKQPYLGLVTESRDVTANSLYASGDRFLGEEPCDSVHSSRKSREAHSKIKNSKSAEVTESGFQDGDYDDDDVDSDDSDDRGTDGADEVRSEFTLGDEETNPFGPTRPNIDDADDGGIHFTNNITPTSNSFEGANNLASSEQSMALVRRPKASTTDEVTNENDTPGNIPSPVRHAALILAPSARVLCYTMDYHPMNLEHFIFAYVREDDKAKLSPRFDHGVCPCHCGHLLPTLEMLSAICDGLCHIHTRKIAHRDIKPANILISVHKTKPDNASFVDLGGCPECQLSCESGPAFDNPARYAVPHVTDFGTAVVIGCQKAHANAGTRAYNPGDPTPTAKSDVYALGVIALEMFSCPATGSERARVRDSRRVQGNYSADVKLAMQAGIYGMTQKDAETRWGMDEVRDWISQLRTMCSQSEQRVAL